MDEQDQQAPPSNESRDVILSQQLSAEGEYIIDSWQQFQKSRQELQRQETWEISQVFGFVALLYEKIRNTVENKDEHVIRRYAIERALKRLDKETFNNQDRAERLIKELTWSRFLPNNSINRSQLESVVQILDKYTQLLQSLKSHSQPNLSYTEAKSWILSIASTELEEAIAPSYTRLHLVPTMFVWLKKYGKITGTDRPTEELEMQIFLATHRALAKSDNPILRYHLFLLFHPTWQDLQTDQIDQIASQFAHTHQQTEKLLHDPQKNQIFRQVKKNTPPFLFLEQLLHKSSNIEQILKNPDQLDQAIQEVASQKYSKIKSDLRKGTIRSILYIFATKVIFALLIEVPYERYVIRDVNALSIGINMLLPPALMFLIAQTVKVPDADNTRRVLNRLHNVVYQQPEPIQYFEISIRSQSKNKISHVFNALYIYVFIVMSIVVAYFLMDTLNFNVVSTALFFVFVSLVLLFSFRLRWQAQELLVEKPKQSLFDHLIAILSIPFINIGVMLSSTISHINFITFLLDHVIDAPLKSSVNSAEEWTQFLKSKQQEAVEVPGD